MKKPLKQIPGTRFLVKEQKRTANHQFPNCNFFLTGKALAGVLQPGESLESYEERRAAIHKKYNNIKN